MRMQIVDFWNKSAAEAMVNPEERHGSFVIGQGFSFMCNGLKIRVNQPDYRGQEDFAFTLSRDHVEQFIIGLGGKKVVYSHGSLD